MKKKPIERKEKPAARKKRATSAPRWRVGRKVGRTLYHNDCIVGMVDNAHLAAIIVEAMNGDVGEFRRKWRAAERMIGAASLALAACRTKADDAAVEAARMADGLKEEQAKVAARDLDIADRDAQIERLSATGWALAARLP